MQLATRSPNFLEVPVEDGASLIEAPSVVPGDEGPSSVAEGTQSSEFISDHDSCQRRGHFSPDITGDPIFSSSHCRSRVAHVQKGVRWGGFAI